MTDREREIIEWLRHRIEYYGRYHHHKETMAWVATALYIPGVIVLALETRVMASGCGWNKGLLISLIIIAGLLIFSFVKWQFDRRWKAHVRVWYGMYHLKNAVFSASPVPEPNDLEELPRGCDEYKRAVKHLLKCGLWCECRLFRKIASCCKRERICDELQPIVSEVITYAAIAFSTLAATLIVGLAGVRCWHCG